MATDLLIVFFTLFFLDFMPIEIIIIIILSTMITRVTYLLINFDAVVLGFLLIASAALQILRVNRQKPRPGPRPTTRPSQND